MFAVRFTVSCDDPGITWFQRRTLLLRSLSHGEQQSARQAVSATKRELSSSSDMPNAIVHRGVGELDPGTRNVAKAITAREVAGTDKSHRADRGNCFATTRRAFPSKVA